MPEELQEEGQVKKLDAAFADTKVGGEEEKEEEKEARSTLLAAQKLLRGCLDCLENNTSRSLSKGMLMCWTYRRPIRLLRKIDKLLNSASGAHK